MSENQNRRVPEYAKYDAMTTEELEEILRLDLEAPEGQESDTEALLYVMEVLTNRKRTASHTGNTAQEALESFKKNYMPEIEDEPAKELKTKSSALRWLRRLTAAIIVIAIILVGSATAKAFGVDIWATVVKWTQETFHFGSLSDTNNGPCDDGDLEFSSLQEALTNAGIDEKLAPTWIPDNYQLNSITVQQTPLQDVYIAQYVCEELELVISIRNHLDSAPQYIEQSDDFSEIYEAGAVEYFIFINHERSRAVWINKSYECSILGELTIEELKAMIDSIEKG